MSAGRQRLSAEHRLELEGQSVIDTAIVAERGYETITAEQNAYLTAQGIQVRSRDAFPNACRCSRQDTRRGPCSSATTSFRTATSEPPRCSFKGSQGRKRGSPGPFRLWPKAKGQTLLSKFGGAARI